MNIEDVLDKEKVVNELDEALKRSELSQSWGANRLGITKAYMCRIINRQAKPSLDLAIEMKKLTNKLLSLGSKNAV